MPKCMLLLVCALAIAVLTRAQEPFRFMDINQQASPSQGPSAWLGAPRWVDVDYHSGPTQALGRLPKVLGWHYFVVNYGELGAELWRTRLGSPSTVCHVSAAPRFRSEACRWGWSGAWPYGACKVGSAFVGEWGLGST
jgi:hypothetical protein